MKNIIKKAIEGGWNDKGTFGWSTTNKQTKLYNYSMIVLDPLFWQALGKACVWTQIYKGCGRKDMAMCLCDYDVKINEWEYHALRFHEYNLTQGWDKAIEYLEHLI